VTAQPTTPPPRLLVVDDDHRYGKWLGHHLGVFCPDSRVSVLTHTEFESWCETEPGRESDIVLLTASFGSSPEDPKARGLELLRRLRMRPVFPAVISLAEEGNELTAVRALQLGAVDYLPKRLLTPERLNTSVRLALRRLEKRALRKAIAATTHVTEAPPSSSDDETTREQPKVNGAPLPLKEPRRNHGVADIDADEAHGRSIIEALLDPKSDVELIAPAAPTPATAATQPHAATSGASAPASAFAAAPSATAHTSAGATPPSAPASAYAAAPSAARASAGLARSSHPYAAPPGPSAPASTAAMSHTSTHAPVQSAAVLATPAAALSHVASASAGASQSTAPPGSATGSTSGVTSASGGPAASAPYAAPASVSAAAAAAKLSPTSTHAPLRSAGVVAPASSADSALSGLFAAHVAKAASAADPDAANTNSTQLMAPGALAAALDEAAASSMMEAIRPTDSGVLGTNTLTPGKSSRGSSKRASTAAAPVTAEFIPGYIIKMKIGESEKAVVYLATSISLGSNVALKVSKTLRDDAAGRQFLEREYTAIIAIRDPLVVQIYDYGVHAGFEYLAMEYLLRGDLKARMHAGIKEAEALRYVEQIASALRVVHNAGLLHRDLKPPNVMLRENDEVALIDFGLARALDGSTRSTRTGVLRGSPYYMSPEQAQGELLDARSDFYSLGIILYEMLTGRKPYTGATAMEVLQQHVNSPLPPLPHSLARYEHLLRKLSAKNRAERFGKADEIIAAVQELRAAITLNVESAVA
jgi:DNA-binding response OmpR family regulator